MRKLRYPGLYKPPPCRRHLKPGDEDDSGASFASAIYIEFVATHVN